jgi:hypothetical protein
MHRALVARTEDVEALCLVAHVHDVCALGQEPADGCRGLEFEEVPRSSETAPSQDPSA